MGAAASIETPALPVNVDSKITENILPPTSPSFAKRPMTRNINSRKKNRIFEYASIQYKGVDNPDLKKNDQEIDENTYLMLRNVLQGFFSATVRDNHEVVDKLIQSMDKIDMNAEEIVIVEGESGSNLYIIDSGEVQIMINGKNIRTMGKGCVLGELALLYDAPRSATVKCLTRCSFWILHRDVFKNIQVNISTLDQVQKSRALVNVPELALLSTTQLSRLVGALQARHVYADDLLYFEGRLTDVCLVISKGTASVYSADEEILSLSPSELDAKFSIFRPINESQQLTKNQIGLHESRAIYGKWVCDVGSGCVIGFGSLRGKANIINGWKWIRATSTEVAGNNETMKVISGLVEGAICPFSLISNGSLYYDYFSVSAVEKLYGSVKSVFRKYAVDADNQNLSLIITEQESVKVSNVAAKFSMKFDSTKFQMNSILGEGSFGTVILAQYPVEGTSSSLSYALKCLSKAAVVSSGQVRHVIDERKVLSELDCPFIIKLYGFYQTPHQLVMVTEALQFGDLWGVMYDTTPYCDQGFLNVNLATFYMAIVILALDHIHRSGYVYRDLKPENLLLDSKGHIRIIDFGFCKKVPYSKFNGSEEIIISKTYTMCGTPGNNIFCALF